MVDDPGTTDSGSTARPRSEPIARTGWGDAAATTTVVEAIADATDTALVDLPPLADAIDPDALDALFTPDADTDLTLTFVYAHHHITVTGHGRILLEPITS